MIETIAQLRENHQQFDMLWNEIGRETQELMVKNAPQLLERLGVWYNQQNSLIAELEDKSQEFLQELVEKDDEEVVVFTEIEVSQDLTCGSIFTLYSDVINVGSESLDDIYAKLTLEGLDQSYVSEVFNLDDDDYDDREKSLQFVGTLPLVFDDGDYILKLYAYNEEDEPISSGSITLSPGAELGNFNVSSPVELASGKGT